MSARRSSRSSRNRAAGWKRFLPGRRFWLRFAVLLCSLLAISLFWLDYTVRAKFDGKRWDIPARVYARPLELYPGLPLTPEQLEEELLLAGYRHAEGVSHAGSYQRRGERFHLISRAFDFGEGPEPSRELLLRFDGDRLAAIETAGGEPLPLARLDPAQIGSFHPLLFEDRIVIGYRDIPPLLRATLLAVEDRNFFEHHGVDPRAILRAMWVNLRAGRTVQGGSTITQQLVKNFYLDSRQTLLRKLNEALMATLLELHYDKEAILTAYVNEVYLGQDGNRAIHGFALASHFYFRQDLGDLSPAQIASLVGMVKGPSAYDPVRFPQRHLARRQTVLAVMAEQGLIDAATRQAALAAPACDPAGITSGINRFPAFLDLVKRQLLADYREEDLTGNGIKILTTLDPLVQRRAEQAVEQTVAALERATGTGELQAAVVVTSRGHGEIEAMVGDRRPGFAGFDRALDARRPIGSLVKPAVYLTALAEGYTVASALDDRKVRLANPDGSGWQPDNFDRQEHGEVPLFQALAHSYNLATVRLGMAVGVDKVVDTLRRLGAECEVPAYPSLLLGAVEMAPIEVAQIYQTLAGGGFYAPLRAIRTVLDADNRPLKRFPVRVEQRFPPESVFLLNTMLQYGVRHGTGRSLAGSVDPGLRVAGKTGTSNDLRDSWFAGFSGDRLTVVWLGRDDNRPLRLTGATGALVLWGRLMGGLANQPLTMPQPPGIVWRTIRPEGYATENASRWQPVKLPFLAGTAPEVSGRDQPAARKRGGTVVDWLKNLLPW